MSVIDNGSMLLLRYVTDWGRFYGEIAELLYQILKEKKAEKQQKDLIGLEKNPKKNFSVYYMRGLSIEETKILLQKNDIPTDFILQNSKGDVLVAIPNKKVNDLTKIQWEINEGHIDLDYYLKARSIFPEQDNTEVLEDFIYENDLIEPVFAKADEILEKRAKEQEEELEEEEGKQEDPEESEEDVFQKQAEEEEEISEVYFDPFTDLADEKKKKVNTASQIIPYADTEQISSDGTVMIDIVDVSGTDNSVSDKETTFNEKTEENSNFQIAYFEESGSEQKTHAADDKDEPVFIEKNEELPYVSEKRQLFETHEKQSVINEVPATKQTLEQVQENMIDNAGIVSDPVAEERAYVIKPDDNNKPEYSTKDQPYQQAVKTDKDPADALKPEEQKSATVSRYKEENLEEFVRQPEKQSDHEPLNKNYTDTLQDKVNKRDVPNINHHLDEKESEYQKGNKPYPEQWHSHTVLNNDESHTVYQNKNKEHEDIVRSFDERPNYENAEQIPVETLENITEPYKASDTYHQTDEPEDITRRKDTDSYDFLNINQQYNTKDGISETQTKKQSSYKENAALYVEANRKHPDPSHQNDIQQEVFIRNADEAEQDQIKFATENNEDQVKPLNIKNHKIPAFQQIDTQNEHLSNAPEEFSYESEILSDPVQTVCPQNTDLKSIDRYQKNQSYHENETKQIQETVVIKEQPYITKDNDIRNKLQEKTFNQENTIYHSEKQIKSDQYHDDSVFDNNKKDVHYQNKKWENPVPELKELSYHQTTEPEQYFSEKSDDIYINSVENSKEQSYMGLSQKPYPDTPQSKIDRQDFLIEERQSYAKGEEFVYSTKKQPNNEKAESYHYKQDNKHDVFAGKSQEQSYHGVAQHPYPDIPQNKTDRQDFLTEKRQSDTKGENLEQSVQRPYYEQRYTDTVLKEDKKQARYQYHTTEHDVIKNEKKQDVKHESFIQQPKDKSYRTNPEQYHGNVSDVKYNPEQLQKKIVLDSERKYNVSDDITKNFENHQQYSERQEDFVPYTKNVPHQNNPVKETEQYHIKAPNDTVKPDGAVKTYHQQNEKRNDLAQQSQNLPYHETAGQYHISKDKVDKKEPEKVNKQSGSKHNDFGYKMESPFYPEDNLKHHSDTVFYETRKQKTTERHEESVYPDKEQFFNNTKRATVNITQPEIRPTFNGGDKSKSVTDYQNTAALFSKNSGYKVPKTTLNPVHTLSEYNNQNADVLNSDNMVQHTYFVPYSDQYYNQKVKSYYLSQKNDKQGQNPESEYTASKIHTFYVDVGAASGHFNFGTQKDFYQNSTKEHLQKKPKDHMAITKNIPYAVFSSDHLDRSLHDTFYIEKDIRKQVYAARADIHTLYQYRKDSFPTKVYSNEQTARSKKEAAIFLTQQIKQDKNRIYQAKILGNGNDIYNAFTDTNAFINKTVLDRDLNTEMASVLAASFKEDRRDFQMRNNDLSYNEIVYGFKKGMEKEAFGDKDNVYNLFGQDTKKQQREVFINRLELRNKKTSVITGKIIVQSGEFLLNPGTASIHESAVYEGVQNQKGLNKFASAFSSSNYAHYYSQAIYTKLNKRLSKNKGYISELDAFLIHRGYGGLNFSDKFYGDRTIESFSEMLKNAGLASKRGAYWDYTKFIRLYTTNSSQVLSSTKLGVMIPKKDLQPLIRALGLEYMDSVKSEKLVHEIAKMVDFSKNIADAKKVKRFEWKSFVSLTLKALVGENAVVSGFNQMVRIYKSITSSIKAAKVASILTFKLLYNLASYISRKIHVKGKSVYDNLHDTKLFQVKSNWSQKNAEKQKQKSEKERQKNKKKQDRKLAKKQRKEKRQKAIMSRLDKKFGNSKIYRKITAKIPVVNKVMSKLNPLKIFGVIGFINKWKTRLKLLLALIVAIVFLVLIIYAEATNLVANLLITVPGFFSGLSIFDSVPYTTMETLQEAEREWKSSLEDTDTYDDFKNMLFGSSYLSASEYAALNGMTFNSSKNGFEFSSPFGFEIPEDAKKIVKNIDAGIEVKLQNSQSDRGNTSNIKDILCMAAVFYDNDVEYGDYYIGGSGVLDASIKKSGLSDSIVDKNVRNVTNIHGDDYRAFLQYCMELFNISHQESVDVYPVVLLTDLNYDADDDISDDMICPKKHGCTTYDHFLYQNGNIAIRDVNGLVHEVDSLVTPVHNYDNCNATDVTGFKNALINNLDCFKVVTETEATEWEKIREWSVKDLPTIDDVSDETEESEEIDELNLTDEDEIVAVYSLDEIAKRSSSFESVIRSLCLSHGIHYSSEDLQIYQLADGRFKVETYKEKETEEHSEYLPDKKLTYYYEQEREIIESLIFTNECAENHSGSYCGGHLKAEVTGYIYTMTTEQENNIFTDKTQGVIPEKVNETTLNPNGDLYAMYDIFDCDTMLLHETQTPDWKGWNEENIEIAALKKIQDWEDLYGFSINNMLGGETLSADEITSILRQVEGSYELLYGEPLPERRREVILKALQLVGNLGYSDPDPDSITFGHHACPFDGPCVLNPNITCYMSDCSGFVSNLWIQELGCICNTTDFKNLNPVKVSQMNSLPKPGDIITWYDATTKHSALYIGDISMGILSGTKTYIVDCNDLGNLGQTVFFRSVNSIDDCYYYNPLGD